MCLCCMKVLILLSFNGEGEESGLRTKEDMSNDRDRQQESQELFLKMQKKELVYTEYYQT